MNNNTHKTKAKTKPQDRTPISHLNINTKVSDEERHPYQASSVTKIESGNINTNKFTARKEAMNTRNHATMENCRLQYKQLTGVNEEAKWVSMHSQGLVSNT